VTVNLKQTYAKLNESLAKTFDSLGVRRAFTAPYTEGHSMADHVKSVGAISDQHGGLATNLLSSYHHSGKSGWGSGEGETVAHPVAKLQETIIPKDSEAAKEAVQAAQTHLNGFKELLGKDDPDVLNVQSQLNLVKKTDGANMSAFDFGVMLQQIMFSLTQKVTRTHMLANANTPASEMESGLGHAEPQEQGPEEAQGVGGGQETAQGATQTASQGSEAAPAQTAQQGAPQAAQTAPTTAPQAA
jgi:hypothetical protein